MKGEGQAQDVWGLQGCHPPKGKELMGDEEGFGGQIEKAVGYLGQVTFNMSLGHLKEMRFNRQLAVCNNDGNNPIQVSV